MSTTIARRCEHCDATISASVMSAADLLDLAERPDCFEWFAGQSDIPMDDGELSEWRTYDGADYCSLYCESRARREPTRRFAV